MKNGPFTVQVVDDHHMMRLGLKALAQTSGILTIDWIESAKVVQSATAAYTMSRNRWR